MDNETKTETNVEYLLRRVRELEVEIFELKQQMENAWKVLMKVQ